VAFPGGLGRRLGGPGFELVERARAVIERYGMTAPGDTILVALSGGPDSTCLLDVLARLAEPLGLTLHVAHVDHGLSPGSKEHAAALSSAAARAGYEVHLVRAPDLSGPNLHARARAFRYSFFETVAEQIGAARIATGHTLDDRVETLLARLLHGAATGVLAGIPPSDGRRIRPLIELRRKETRAYCEEVGLAFIDDPANDDPRFERARVRNLIVPLIEEHWGEGALRAIARSAQRLREDAAALDALAEAAWSTVAPGGPDRLERGPLAELPPALARRVVERAVGRVRDRAGGIDAALEALHAGKSGVRFAVAEGIELELSAANLAVRRPTKGPPDGPADRMSR
jgi:tRNA(Ile)-lysidine synthase